MIYAGHGFFITGDLSLILCMVWKTSSVFPVFFIFSSARSSCFHKSEIFICPILLQNNNSSPEFFPFCRNFAPENVMNMFDNYFTVFTHIFQDFLITQIAGIKNTKSENFIVDFMTEKAQEIKIFTFFLLVICWQDTGWWTRAIPVLFLSFFFWNQKKKSENPII